MKRYELTCLISSDLSNSDIQKTQEDIESFIMKNEGEVLNSKIDPAKRELGYKIKGKEDGYLASFVFIMDSFKTIELGNRMREKKEIIRHILICKEDFKKEILEPKKKLERMESKKMELKDIDRKIEEILSE